MFRRDFLFVFLSFKGLLTRKPEHNRRLRRREPSSSLLRKSKTATQWSMSQTKDVHLGFYRQEDSTIELTKVASKH